MSHFHKQTAGSISTKFFTGLHANTGKVFNTTMTRQLDPWTQSLKP